MAKKTYVFIDGARDGYSPEQCSPITVGELIRILENFDEDLPILLKNDNGYTYGEISEYSINEEVYSDDEEDEEDEEEEY